MSTNYNQSAYNQSFYKQYPSATGVYPSHYGYYPSARYQDSRVTSYVPRAALSMAGVGAIVGGTAAAAKNIRKLKNAEITHEEAVKDTIKQAAGAAVATGTATAAVGATGVTGVVSLLGILVVATGTKYLWDGITGTE